MQDLKVYYKDDKRINVEFDKKMDKLAKEFGLTFTGSGFDYQDKIRDIHFIEKKKRKVKNARSKT